MRLRPDHAGGGGRGKKLICEGDSEASIAYFCLHELHKWPHEFFTLSREERAAVIACIEVRAEEEKKRQREMRRNRKR